MHDNELKNDKVYIYFHPVTGEGDKDTDKLTDQYRGIFNTLYEYVYITSISYFNMHFSVNHCQAENDLSYCVFPNGNVAKCQREKPEISKHSVFEENFLEKLNSSWKSEHFIEDESVHCQNCISYPLCKGGCKIHDLSKLTKMHCDRCYIYHGCYEAILEYLVKIYSKSFN